MFRRQRETPLPEQWQDRRIQSAAALLNFGAGVTFDPELAQEAEDRLQQVAAQHHLDPDQVFRALYEHESFLSLQEEDHHLRQIAFKSIF